MTVRPLLQYYGVASLAKGLILTVSAAKGAEALKPSHGLEPQNWKATLTRGLSAFPDLAVAIRNGTFHELLEATGNRSYLKANSSAVNWKVDFPQPKIGDIFSFGDVASSMPDVAADYRTWSCDPLVSAQVDSVKHADASKRYELSIQGRTKPEIINELFKELGGSVTIESSSGKHNVTIPDTYHPYFCQLREGTFGIGDVHLVRPIRGTIYLNTLAQYFAASYILGMVVRYFPSIWISLSRQQKGDRIDPLVRRLVTLIQNQFPQIVLEYLRSPYDFEKTTEEND